MTSEDALPDYLASSLSQSVSRTLEAAIQDPVVYASGALVDAKIAAVRRCVDKAISTVLAARNLQPLNESEAAIWQLVWAYLPIRDLLSVTHVCRGWREIALDHPALWTRLEVQAWEGDDPEFLDFIAGDDSPTLSDLHMLYPILSRSRTMDVTIEVNVKAHETTDVFQSELRLLLLTAAPRLGVLRIFTMNPELPGSLFNLFKDVEFPRLRTLALFSETMEDDDYDDGTEYNFLFDFRRLSLPSLSRLEIHSCWRPVYTGPYPKLEHLRCTVNRMQDLEPLLLSSPELQVVIVKCRGATFDIDATSGHAPLLATLNAVPEICITTPRDLVGDERIFRVFANSQTRRSLLLDFDCSSLASDVPFLPQQCSALTSATQLTLSRRTDRAVVIDAVDAVHPERVVKFALTNPQRWPQELSLTIDWARMAALNSLLSLTVDAKIWSTVMVNFPAVPQLRRVTLKFAAAADLDDLLAAQPMPVLPAVVPVTLASDKPISVDPARVDALKQALRAVQLTMENISLG
ncbi:hypothetical protein AURDEDRAFT_165889 [Auricularia subglabra TFB-10046 SS5]|nr:hypothetical protein AURDEDRAFT_165889 [Auricularia subglabra TFB-10046 SS5]